MGFVALYHVFRFASACQRTAIKDKNQPILHIFNNIKNEFPKSIQSFYKYVHSGYFSSINDEMLPRSFSYKPRTRKEKIKTISRNNIIKIGRRFEDYQKYIKDTIQKIIKLY